MPSLPFADHERNETQLDGRNSLAHYVPLGGDDSTEDEEAAAAAEVVKNVLCSDGVVLT